MVTIYLTRHGETDWNLTKKIQGPKSSRLTKRGIQQAKDLKNYFNKEKIRFDKIFCSPTIRTKEMLKIIFHDYKNQKNIFLESNIEERLHSDLIGLTKIDIEIKVKKKVKQRLSWELYFEGTDRSILTNHFPNDEQLNRVETRIINFTEKLSFLSNGALVLIIGHSIFNQFLLEFFKFKTIGKNQFDDFQKNNEIRILKLDKSLKLKSMKKIFVG